MSDAETRGADALPQRTGAELERLLGRPLDPGLHVIATPIGNLGDITLRGLATLAQVDVVYCEDTRHSRTLLSHFGIGVRTRAYHEHNADHERPRILEALARGQRVGLISDAGTPLISDPGYKLVRDVIAAGHAVHALPGPCAAIAALTIAGLPTDSFLFAGFLPPKSGQRQARLKLLAGSTATIVLYEAPNRVADALADVLAVLGDRPCVIARELTKLHEEIQRGSVASLIEADLDGLRGEVVILLGAAQAAEVSDDDIREALAALPSDATTRDAAREVAARLGVQKSRVYDLAVSGRRQPRDDAKDN